MSIRTIPILGIFDGAILCLAAILAPNLGLDPNAAWGKGRLAILILGLLILLVSITLLSFNKRLPGFLSSLFQHERWNTLVVIAHLWAIILIFYLWLITYGNWTAWGHTTSYYDKLATSFSEGHLYINIKPDPALLAVPNPYSPQNRPPIQNDVWDMALYNGKFYLYWGPVPALLITPLKWIDLGKITDNYLVFFFYSALLVINSLLILKIRNRLFPQVPTWAMLICIPLVGLLAPIPWSVSEPNIYDAAVGAGQFFLMGGIFWAFTAFDTKQQPSNLFLFLTGLFWAAAVGSRGLNAVTILPPVAILAVWIFKNHKPLGSMRSRWVNLFALGLPLGAGALIMAWYNWARFGSILEFGFRYCISIWDLNKSASLLFLPAYIPSNLLVYLFQPIHFQSAFPFIQTVMASDFFHSIGFTSPDFYYTGKVAGLLFSVPFLLTVLTYPFQRKVQPTEAQPELDPSYRKLVLWVLLSAFLTGLVLLLIFFVGSMRYLMDVISPITLLAIMAFWNGITGGFRSTRARRIFLGVVVVLILLSILTGFLLAFSAETNRFQELNPELFNRIVHLFPIFH